METFQNLQEIAQNLGLTLNEENNDVYSLTDNVNSEVIGTGNLDDIEEQLNEIKKLAKFLDEQSNEIFTITFDNGLIVKDGNKIVIPKQFFPQFLEAINECFLEEIEIQLEIVKLTPKENDSIEFERENVKIELDLDDLLEIERIIINYQQIN